MKVILHVGAHRCATTSFQSYMRANADALRVRGIGFWGPGRTRSGLFSGLVPKIGRANWRVLARRAVSRVQVNLENSARKGVSTLIVSDENMIGGMVDNLTFGELYGDARPRLAHFNRAFRAYPCEVVLGIRRQDAYWSSVLGFVIGQGRGFWGAHTAHRLAYGHRCWRDVIGDVASAMPRARVRVAPFEDFAGRPDVLLGALTGPGAGPKSHRDVWKNRTPPLADLRRACPEEYAGLLPEGDGPWNPFSEEAAARLRENYADDLHWLAAGADGLATQINEDESTPGANPGGTVTRGSNDDRQSRPVANARRGGTARQATG